MYVKMFRDRSAKRLQTGTDRNRKGILNGSFTVLKGENMMIQEENLERLTRKAMRGNCDAFGQLIHSFQDYLYRMAFLYLRNEDAALDVVQECILHAYEAIGDLKQPAYFKTWITRILINCANTYRKKNSKVVLYETIPEREEKREISAEERMDLQDALDRLPEDYRTAVILKYYNDMKVSEIASVMKLPEGTVKSLLFRARAVLKSDLEEDYGYGQ